MPAAVESKKKYDIAGHRADFVRILQSWRQTPPATTVPGQGLGAFDACACIPHLGQQSSCPLPRTWEEEMQAYFFHSWLTCPQLNAEAVDMVLILCTHAGA